MIAAIMQPYFFPYIGYFQLMQAVDTFVIFDDVQYIDRGWVNRNRIQNNGVAAWLTLPVQKASRNLPINKRHYHLAGGDAVRRVEQRLQASYAKASCWPEIAPLLFRLLGFDDANVATFNANLLEVLARRLGAGCRFIFSSSIDKPGELKGNAKVIDLCRRIGATHYVNPIGGIPLYPREVFEQAQIELSFLQTRAMPIQVGTVSEHLSIIDTMMHHGTRDTAAMLQSYDLVN